MALNPETRKQAEGLYTQFMAQCEYCMNAARDSAMKFIQNEDPLDKAAAKEYDMEASMWREAAKMVEKTFSL